MNITIPAVLSELGIILLKEDQETTLSALLYFRIYFARIDLNFAAHRGTPQWMTWVRCHSTN